MKNANNFITASFTTIRLWIALSLLFSTGWLMAQESQNPIPDWKVNPMEINISAGYPPLFIPYWWYYSNTYKPNYSNTSEQVSYLGPSVNINFSYKCKSWLAFGVYGSVAYLGHTTYRYYDNSVVHERGATYLGITPQVRFDWLNRKYLTLYTGAAVGFAMVLTSPNPYSPANYDNYLAWMFDATLIGVKVGRKWYGMGEFGYTNTGLFKLGVGYRFNKGASNNSPSIL